MSHDQCKAKSADILNAMSEEQLKDLLRTEMLSADTNVELIKKINAILNEKTARHLVLNVDEEWQEFVSEHSFSEPLNTADEPLSIEKISQSTALSRRRFLTRVVVAVTIVIVLLIGSTITAQAFGIDIWGVLAQWTSEIFSLSSNSSSDDATSGYPQNVEEFDYLQSVLDSCGITGKLVPKYLPEGFKQVDFFYDDSGASFILTSTFSNGNEMLVVQYSTQESGQFQKDNIDPEIYEVGGIKHYIMTNMDNYKVVWINGKIECCIYGIENKDYLIKMVDSIY